MYPDLGKKIEAFVGFAPVMYLGHQTSSLVTVLMKWHLDQIVDNLLTTFLYYGHTLFTSIGPVFIERLPRTVWAFV